MVEMAVHVAGEPALLSVSFWSYSARSGRECSKSGAFFQGLVTNSWAFLCTHLDRLMCSSWNSCIWRDGGVFEFSILIWFWVTNWVKAFLFFIFTQQNSFIWCPLLLLKLQVFWNCIKLYFLGAFFLFVRAWTSPSFVFSIHSIPPRRGMKLYNFSLHLEKILL